MAGNSDEPPPGEIAPVAEAVPEPEPVPEPEAVDNLVRAGRHAEAARAALARGDHARAIELFEKVWDFRGALEAARAAGDLPRALRYAIELASDPEVAELLAALTAPEDGARAAHDVLAKLRR
ncbi:MAG TPA: hypothetical protein VK932_06180, partial [Kofleriaceae bacterium]|nr:hypothetical protein [Kofleriaceae bacterium]